MRLRKYSEQRWKDGQLGRKRRQKKASRTGQNNEQERHAKAIKNIDMYLVEWLSVEHRKGVQDEKRRDGGAVQ